MTFQGPTHQENQRNKMNLSRTQIQKEQIHPGLGRTRHWRQDNVEGYTFWTVTPWRRGKGSGTALFLVRCLFYDFIGDFEFSRWDMLIFKKEPLNIVLTNPQSRARHKGVQRGDLE
jgi:hypothetical protein